MSKKTVIGVFNDAAEADAAVRDLESKGFSPGESRTLSNVAMGTAGGAGTAYDLRPELEEQGVPASDATYFIQCFADGKPLLEVIVEEWDRAETAANILVDRGAQGPIEEIAGTTEMRGAGAERLAPEIPEMEPPSGVERAERETRRRTRIYSRMVEEPVVEHRPAERPATEAELREAEGKVVEPVIEKEARVVEEVVIKKEVTEEIKVTEVHVEKEPEKEKEEQK